MLLVTCCILQADVWDAAAAARLGCNKALGPEWLLHEDWQTRQLCRHASRPGMSSLAGHKRVQASVTVRQNGTGTYLWLWLGWKQAVKR
jgi:hypothetical protein